MSASSKIVGSVGCGGRNRHADVEIVQGLLNGKLPAASTPLKVDGLCGPKTIHAIRDYQRRMMKIQSPDGLIAPDGMTFRSLKSAAAAAPGLPAPHPVKPAPPAVSGPPPTPTVGGHKYTASPYESVTTRTTPLAQDVIKVLRAAWPQLNDQGARTLTAQFMLETGHGKHCYNWNLGNVKAKESQGHMYLKGVWEVMAASKAAQSVRDGHGLAHVATAAEISKHGWRGNGTIVVFDPPHPQARFRAYPSLAEGAARWIEHHQKIAAKNPAFLPALNSGKTEAVAHALKQAHYYTADESDYAKGMAKAKAEIDRTARTT